MSTTIVNTHPTQGFWKHYHSQDLIFQPQMGEWAPGTEVIELPPRQEGEKAKKRTIRVLKCVDPKKKCPPYTDVPSDAVKSVLEGEFASKNEEGAIDVRHHGGALRAFAEVHTEMSTKLEAAQKELAETRARIEANKAENDSIAKETQRLIAERAAASVQKEISTGRGPRATADAPAEPGDTSKPKK